MKRAGTRMLEREGASSLQVLERTFTVLGLFTPERPEWTTTEVARQSDLPIPTAHRILATLLRHGFVLRDDRTKGFRLGAAALELGERARAVVDIRSRALPVLRRLTQETGETSLLTVLNETRDRSLCLERVESPQPLRLSVQPGRQLPLHAGASQKVLLAYMSEEEIERLLAGPLERFWRATITNPQALRRDLREIRKRGWAKSVEETNAGAWGIAAPIMDGADSIVAGVGLAGPSARLTEAELLRCLAHLGAATADLAHRLGFRAPTMEPPHIPRTARHANRRVRRGDPR